MLGFSWRDLPLPRHDPAVGYRGEAVARGVAGSGFGGEQIAEAPTGDIGLVGIHVVDEEEVWLAGPGPGTDPGAAAIGDFLRGAIGSRQPLERGSQQPPRR